MNVLSISRDNCFRLLIAFSSLQSCVSDESRWPVAIRLVRREVATRLHYRDVEWDDGGYDCFHSPSPNE